MTIMTEGEHRYNQLIKIFKSEAEPAFESTQQQEEIWGRQWGCPNDVGRLRAVLMHRPGDELDIVDPTKKLPEVGAYGDPAEGWYWRGSEPPKKAALQAEHDGLVALLRDEGVEVILLDRCAPGKMKACYTRDSCIGLKGGALVTRLGPPVRRGEEMPVTQTLARAGCPILRTVNGTGVLEGGSFAWLNENTAVVCISSRTNEEGARQLGEVLRAQGIELLIVEVTGYRLHIDGMLVMLDADLALINPNLLPFSFLGRLKEMGIRTIEAGPDDPTSVINCLAVRPGRIIINDTISERTEEAMIKAGCDLLKIPYENVYAGGGGIHCSTSPLIRDPL